jgi:DNA-binding winged helix-turn-helix (wHTH) protein
MPDKLLYEFGPYRLDPAAHLLFREQTVVAITPKALDILTILVRGHGQLISKDELVSTVWPDTFVEEGNLTQNISLLRKALGTDGDGQTYIETIPKRGYW